jgi:hypothetical protein
VALSPDTNQTDACLPPDTHKEHKLSEPAGAVTAVCWTWLSKEQATSACRLLTRIASILTSREVQVLTTTSLKTLGRVVWYKLTDVLEKLTEIVLGYSSGLKHLWNVGQFLPRHTTQHPRRQSSSYLLHGQSTCYSDYASFVTFLSHYRNTSQRRSKVGHDYFLHSLPSSRNTWMLLNVCQ